MSRDPQHYLGIDFGTSHTYLSVAAIDPVSTCPIFFGAGRQPSIATAVLWERGAAKGNREFVAAFGNQAVDEWLAATDEERKHYRLDLNFKPDIVGSESKRKATLAFLTKVYDYLRDNGKLPQGRPPQDFPVVIGLPACVPDGYESCLKDLAGKAGFSKARMKTVEEPVAALVYHLHRRDLTPRQARAGVLVVDFGGGTCDIAFLLRGEIIGTSGDPTLGGRLFDDLFYQWFVDQNPGVDEKLRDGGHEAFVHWVKCREMKEHFSDRMNGPLEERRRQKFTFTDTLGHGALRDATWDEFLDRAKRYRPDSDMEGCLAGLGSDFRENGEFQENGSRDLVGSFKHLLVEGMKSNGIKREDIDWVILTGGSSNWCFVKDSVREVLRLPADHIHQSSDPSVTIGDGAALLLPLKAKWGSCQNRLTSERGNIARQIRAQENTILEQGTRRLAEELASEFVNEHLAVLLDEFLDKEKESWRIRDLEEAVRTRASTFESTVEQRVREHGEDWDAQIREARRDRLEEWFREIGLPWTVDGIPSAGVVESAVGFAPDPANIPFTWFVRLTMFAIVALFAGLLWGAASGTVALTVGGVGLLSLLIMRQWIEAAVKSILVPKWARPMVLPRKGFLKRTKRRRVNMRRRALTGAVQRQDDSLSSSLDCMFDEETSSLGWLTKLS